MDTTRSFDPRTGEAFGTPFTHTTADELDRACYSAAAAAAPLAAAGAEQRKRWLDAVAAALEDHRDELVPIADHETALGTVRLNGELTRTTFQLRFLGQYAAEGRHRDATVDLATDSPMGPLPDLRRTQIPLGPVAVFAASNFPFAFSVVGGDTASALASGCPVVVKTHHSHPELSERVGQITRAALTAAGAPEGTFATVNGFSAGVPLVQHSAITAAAFTGSLHGGRALFNAASSRPDPIPFFGELGSVNPLIITTAAAEQRLADIAAGWVASLTLGAGQFCTNPGVVLVPRAHADSFSHMAAQAVADVPAAPLLNQGIRDRFRSAVAELAGYGTIVGTSTDEDTSGFRVSATILRSDVSGALNHPALLEEVFGPFGVILEYGNQGEIETILRHIKGSLTATIHAADSDPEAAALLNTAANIAGRVVWNGYPTGVAVSASMQHGGPWPSSTSARDTSVGAAAIARFTRSVSYQDVPNMLLPKELQS